jgi:ferric-dicitrate binding protein FerR (iron transport regulator)
MAMRRREIITLRWATAAIFAALVLCVPAAAQNDPDSDCKEVRVRDEALADTAMCVLNLNTKVVLNERCRIAVAAESKERVIDAGKYVVILSAAPDQNNRVVFTAKWNNGDGRTDDLRVLGPVTPVRRGTANCYQNQAKRFELCVSDFMACR